MRTAVLTALMAVVSISCLAANYPQAQQSAPAADSGQDSGKAKAAAPADPASPNGASPDAADPAKMAAPSTVSKVPGVPVNQKTYVIGAEDVLRIIIWNQAGMSGEFPVRPDGRISIPLVGDVDAAEKTPQQLEQTIAEKLRDMQLILDPHVSVGLVGVHSKKFYIHGEVNRPGAYDLTVPTTILEGLVNAGGFRDFANTKKIRILRGSTEYHFNYNQVSHGKHLEQNIKLEPGDEIFVP